MTVTSNRSPPRFPTSLLAYEIRLLIACCWLELVVEDLPPEEAVFDLAWNYKGFSERRVFPAVDLTPLNKS